MIKVAQWGPEWAVRILEYRVIHIVTKLIHLTPDASVRLHECWLLLSLNLIWSLMWFLMRVSCSNKHSTQLTLATFNLVWATNMNSSTGSSPNLQHVPYRNTHIFSLWRLVKIDGFQVICTVFINNMLSCLLVISNTSCISLGDNEDIAHCLNITWEGLWLVSTGLINHIVFYFHSFKFLNNFLEKRGMSIFNEAAAVITADVIVSWQLRLDLTESA